MRAATFERLIAEVRRAAGVMLDWDGCLAVGERLRDGAVEVTRAAQCFAIVSNNSTMTAATLRARAAEQGLEMEAEQVHLAGEALLREAVRRLPGRRVWLLASREMADAAERLGLHLDDRAPEALLVMRDEAFDYRSLTHAVALLQGGAMFWAANLDHAHPGPHGAVPETGALVAAIQTAAGRRPALVAGKPHPAIFRQALAALGCGADEALMVGDNPRTDLAGAQRIGARAVWVNAGSWVRPTPVRTGVS